MRRTAVLFTLGRFGLFVLMALLIRGSTGLAGHPLNGFPLLLAALLVSSIAGLYLFSRQREQFAQALLDQREAKLAQRAQRRARLDKDGA